jgi:Uma2 family endonuclease
MTVLVTDTYLAARIKAERETCDASWRDEVWDGVYVVSPLADFEHQYLVSLRVVAVQSVLEPGGAEVVLAGVNVSDREEGWTKNYRVPDLAVVLKQKTARRLKTHLCGGPDFVVEILSENDLAREKRGFYATIGVRELLIIDRDPWALELYRLDGGELNFVGKSTADKPDLLVSTVLPLVFRLLPGDPRPKIDVRRADGMQSWTI